MRFSSFFFFVLGLSVYFVAVVFCWFIYQKIKKKTVTVQFSNSKEKKAG